MTLQRLQGQPSPGPHGYSNVISEPRHTEVQNHQYVNVNHSEDYGIIPLQATAVTRQNSFEEVCSKLDIQLAYYYVYKYLHILIYFRLAVNDCSIRVFDCSAKVRIFVTYVGSRLSANVSARQCYYTWITTAYSEVPNSRCMQLRNYWSPTYQST